MERSTPGLPPHERGSPCGRGSPGHSSAAALVSRLGGFARRVGVRGAPRSHRGGGKCCRPRRASRCALHALRLPDLRRGGRGRSGASTSASLGIHRSSLPARQLFEGNWGRATGVVGDPGPPRAQRRRRGKVEGLCAGAYSSVLRAGWRARSDADHSLGCSGSGCRDGTGPGFRARRQLPNSPVHYGPCLAALLRAAAGPFPPLRGLLTCGHHASDDPDDHGQPRFRPCGLHPRRGGDGVPPRPRVHHGRWLGRCSSPADIQPLIRDGDRAGRANPVSVITGCGRVGGSAHRPRPGLEERRVWRCAGPLDRRVLGRDHSAESSLEE